MDAEQVLKTGAAGGGRGGGGSGHVLCEDVFESLVVFSEGWWIGAKEENPDESRQVAGYARRGSGGKRAMRSTGWCPLPDRGSAWVQWGRALSSRPGRVYP